ncbi:hypothetical protein [Sorangium sp. So ce406]|uniref:hypothetical protein n=1 Tax=Sorangium sp. So ce406 TaxID=3133311 RepID=UPI003F5B6DAD
MTELPPPPPCPSQPSQGPYAVPLGRQVWMPFGAPPGQSQAIWRPDSQTFEPSVEELDSA